MRLSADQGARDILKANTKEITYVDVTDRGILIDIDTKQDLVRASAATD